MGKIGVRPHIGRILAAKFEAEIDEAPGRGLLHRLAARDRTGEADHVGMTAGNDVRGLLVVQHQVLEHALGQLRLVEGLLEPLSHQQGIGGVLQHHGIARHRSPG